MGEDQFGKFERRFVYIYYFLPQINRISKYVNPKSFSLKMNQVIWSTVMQHGENIGFIEQALLEAKVGPSTKWTQKIEDAVIERIYDLRMKRGIALRESSIKRFTLKYKTRPVLWRVGQSQSPDERLLFPDLRPRYIAEKEKVLPHPTIWTPRKKV